MRQCTNGVMDDETPNHRPIVEIADELLAMADAARLRGAEDPFGNPVLSVALAITRRVDQHQLDDRQLVALIGHLRDIAFADRAARIAAYVGGVTGNEASMARLAARLVRPDPDDSPIPLARFRSLVERTAFAAVFTAHPTFSLPAAIGHALAEAACGRMSETHFSSHRPPLITLGEEFEQAAAAIARGRDAIDLLCGALLDEARRCWADRWADIVPKPVILTSWVGYDTDGRTDLGWWDTIGLRLRMKSLQLARLAEQTAGHEALHGRVVEALAATDRQIAACPAGGDPDETERFALVVMETREAALISPAPLMTMFIPAIASAEGEAKRLLCIARAGLAAHGLGLAHTHMRLNSSQIHNAARQRLGLQDPPADPSRRRVLISAINDALAGVVPQQVDFGAVLAEQASAVRLMMIAAQMVKHIDHTTPIRFLIAETETGYTLLAALWLARLFGIEKSIEISPLFETPEALTHGGRVIEEALRSPHWRAHLRATGRLCVQFGYSDSGRYVGQIAASYQIERLRLKICELMQLQGLSDVELVLFDTHGESIGRGGHPGSLADRLAYLSPAASRVAFDRAGIAVREESAFQGGDGYLLFGAPELAAATIARIAEHTLGTVDKTADPIYEDPDFAADFFGTIRSGMAELVEDPGYAALLGAFGPALIDRTGSRPVARQVDGIAGSGMLRHPRELRAIPNNAILQQLGWCANTLQGLGQAAAQHPEPFEDFRHNSKRFRRALDFAAHGLAHSDIDVLRAIVATLDPGSWLDRAGHTTMPGRKDALIKVARALEPLGLWAPAQAMFRRIQADHLALRGIWPDAPRMAGREMLLHALRLALIHRIWLLASTIADFSPRHGVTKQMLEARILRLDIPLALQWLDQVFPASADPTAGRHFAEPQAPRAPSAYAREHKEIFEPIAFLFDLVREIGTAITHEVGAFG